MDPFRDQRTITITFDLLDAGAPIEVDITGLNAALAFHILGVVLRAVDQAEPDVRLSAGGEVLGLYSAGAVGDDD